MAGPDIVHLVDSVEFAQVAPSRELVDAALENVMLIDETPLRPHVVYR